MGRSPKKVYQLRWPVIGKKSQLVIHILMGLKAMVHSGAGDKQLLIPCLDLVQIKAHRCNLHQELTGQTLLQELVTPSAFDADLLHLNMDQ